MTNNTKEIPVPHSTVTYYKFDHKTVPVFIHFVTGPVVSYRDEARYLRPYNCVITKRKYRAGDMTPEDMVNAVRRERNLPDHVPVTIIFSGHPRDFLPRTCEAWIEAYKSKLCGRMRNIQGVLDMLGPYDPRRHGESYYEWRDRSC